MTDREMHSIAGLLQQIEGHLSLIGYLLTGAVIVLGVIAAVLVTRK